MYKKETTGIKAETDGIGNKEETEKFTKHKKRFFKNINKIFQPLAQMIKKKERKPTKKLN